MAVSDESRKREAHPGVMFSLQSGDEILLDCPPSIFKPTGTSRLLIDAAMKVLEFPMTTLDLGCGCGVVGLALFRAGLVEPPLFASDLSEDAVTTSRSNLLRHGCRADVRRGSLLEPWAGLRFDVIVEDVSGVAKDVATLSPWFGDVPCESGVDGTDLVVEVISRAPEHLARPGFLIFPVLSLSNVDAILENARRSFSRVECIARQEWPLPAELASQSDTLTRLESEGHLRLIRRFGMTLWYTEVYRASLEAWSH